MFEQVVVKDKHGNLLDRISPWAKYVVQPPKEQGYTFKYIFYNPSSVSQIKTNIIIFIINSTRQCLKILGFWVNNI